MRRAIVLFGLVGAAGLVLAIYQVSLFAAQRGECQRTLLLSPAALRAGRPLRSSEAIELCQMSHAAVLGRMLAGW